MFHMHGFFFGIALYFLPTLIAYARHLYGRGGILLLNLFLGWTFFGWIAALIWAIAAPPPYYHPYGGYPPCPPSYPPYPPYPPRYR